MASINQTLHENTLAEVVQHFDYWRATREKREQIPDELWTLIKSIEKQYTYGELAQALKINHSALKKRLNTCRFYLGIDAIAGYCKQRLQADSMSGAWFAFTNRKKTAVKLLVYDGQGFWLCIKRFSQGRLT